MGRGEDPRPSFLPLGAVQHVQHEADTLTQGDEANGHGQNDGQQANDLVQDAAEHVGGHDLAQNSSGSGILRNSPFLKDMILMRAYALVAGAGLEPTSSDAESDELTATLSRYVDQKKMRRNL